MTLSKKDGIIVKIKENLMKPMNRTVAGSQVHNLGAQADDHNLHLLLWLSSCDSLSLPSQISLLQFSSSKRRKYIYIYIVWPSFYPEF